MFLYTIVPPEQIMGTQNSPEYACQTLHNAFIEGSRGENGFVVSRLISTNPRDYLNPRYAPGKILK